MINEENAIASTFGLRGIHCLARPSSLDYYVSIACGPTLKGHSGMHGVFTLLNSLVVKYAITQNQELLTYPACRSTLAGHAIRRDSRYTRESVRFEDNNHKLMESRI